MRGISTHLLLWLAALSTAWPLAGITAEEVPANEPRPLSTDVISDRVVAAVVVRDIQTLRQRIAQLNAAAESIPPTLQTLDFMMTFLVGGDALDTKRPFGLVVTPTEDDRPLSLENITFVLPHVGDEPDLRQMFRFQVGGRRWIEDMGYVFVPFSTSSPAPQAARPKKPLAEQIDAPLKKLLDQADGMLYVSPKIALSRWPPNYDRLRERLAQWEDRRLRALGMRFLNDLQRLKHLFATESLPGLVELQFTAQFDDLEEPLFLFDRVAQQQSKHAPTYHGLPNRPTVASVAIGDVAVSNVELLLVAYRFGVLDAELNPVSWARGLDRKLTEELDQALVALKQIARQTRSVRAAFYDAAQGQRPVVVLLDTDQPQPLLESIDALVAAFSRYTPAERTEIAGAVARRYSRMAASSREVDQPRWLTGMPAEIVVIPLQDRVAFVTIPDKGLVSELLTNLREESPGLAANFQPATDSLLDVRADIERFLPQAKRSPVAVPQGSFARLAIFATRRQFSAKVDLTTKQLTKLITILSRRTPSR